MTDVAAELQARIAATERAHAHMLVDDLTGVDEAGGGERAALWWPHQPARITAPDCAEHAAAALHDATRVAALGAGPPEQLPMLVEVAAAWTALGVALSQHAALNRPEPE